MTEAWLRHLCGLILERGRRVGGFGRCAHAAPMFGAAGTAGEGVTKPDDLSSGRIRMVQVDD